jgi:hypothetical protein
MEKRVGEKEGREGKEESLESFAKLSAPKCPKNLHHPREKISGEIRPQSDVSNLR